jgi:DNA replication terminus site-binding protein
MQYDLIEQMNQCFNQLELSVRDLSRFLQLLTLSQAKVFVLPEIEKGMEHEPINSIEVLGHHQGEAQHLALQHYQRLFIYHQNSNVSSKSALRLPGALCYRVTSQQHADIEQQVNEVNQLKKRLEAIITVESGLSPEQRFEFVHQHLRGLITLNAYRSITLLTNPATINFGWANKNIIKNVSKKAIMEQLEKSLHAGRAVAPYSREQWAENVAQEIEDVRKLPDGAKLKIKRPVKVQPIARVWYSQLQKQVQHPCPSPLLVLTTDDWPSPKLGALGNYHADQIKHKYKPGAQALRLVIKRLHLYTDDGII